MNKVLYSESSEEDPHEPPVPLAILTYLKKTYPLEGFKNCKDLRELDTYRGTQEVIDLLQVAYDRQNEIEE